MGVGLVRTGDLPSDRLRVGHADLVRCAGSEYAGGPTPPKGPRGGSVIRRPTRWRRAVTCRAVCARRSGRGFPASGVAPALRQRRPSAPDLAETDAPRYPRISFDRAEELYCAPATGSNVTLVPTRSCTDPDDFLNLFGHVRADARRSMSSTCRRPIRCAGSFLGHQPAVPAQDRVLGDGSPSVLDHPGRRRLTRLVWAGHDPPRPRHLMIV